MPYQDISKLGQRREPDPKTFSALAAEALAKDPEWIYGNVLPIAKNREDGSYSAALPGFLRDYLSGWADLITGPSVGENLSPQAVLSILGPGPTAGASSPSMVIGPGARTFDWLSAFVNPLRGGDRIPRNTISDALSELAPMEELVTRPPAPGANIPAFRLASIMYHRDLFDAYPGIKNMIVGLDKNLGTTRGQYNPSVDYITLNPNASQESIHGTLLHELQHAIQKREGFTSGGNPKNFLPQDYDAVYDLLMKLPRDKEAETARYNLDKMAADALFNYRRVPGEMEARATQNKFLFDQRKDPPVMLEAVQDYAAPKGWNVIEPTPRDLRIPYAHLPEPYNHLDMDPSFGNAYDPAQRQQYEDPRLRMLSEMLRERLSQ